MGLPVFVGSAFVAQYPTGGGNFWVPLQYLLGLRALGVEAHWLELLWAGGDRRRAQFVGAFRGAVERLGVAEWVTLVCFPEGSRDGPPGQAEHHGLAPAELRARARDALLLNLANSVTARPLAFSGTVSVVRPARAESAVLTTSTLRAATLRANAATSGFASNAMILPA